MGASDTDGDRGAIGASARYRIVHATRFEFDAPIERCRGRARLTPGGHGWQVDFAQLVTGPLADRIAEGEDRFGNATLDFEVAGPLQRLSVTGIHHVSSKSEAKAPEDPAPRFDPASATEATAPCAAIEALWRPEASKERMGLDALMQSIRRAMHFDAAATGPATTAAQALASGRGVCHDYAHIALAALRHRGIEAAFVWGYRMPARGPTRRASGPRMLGGDSLSHAWVSVRLPGQGWRAVDPTTGTWPGQDYLEVARGRDLRDVQAVEGAFDGRAAQRIDVDITIEAIDAEPG